jgi:alpha-mannosidase
MIITKLRTFIFALSLVGLLSCAAAAQQKRIYIAPDDHTDYMWSANEATYKSAFLNMTDYYLDRMDATAGSPSPYQARWNPDGSFWMWTYEKNRTAAQFDRFINRIRDGHMSVPLNALVLVNGGTPAEAVLRGMYYPGLLERRYNLRFPTAIAMEDQTFPYGLASLWAGSGAHYSWKGVCGCATRLTQLENRDREIYYAGGPDGSRVLMKWNSLFSNVGQNLGNYYEAQSPTSTINFVDSNSSFLSRYPYQVIGAFGQGGDDLQTTNDDFIAAAQAGSNANRQVVVSNQLDFFQDFENTYGSTLSTFAAAYGNEWELYVSSMAEVSARVKRAAEKLRNAEAMATLVSLRNPSFMDSRTAARDKAMLDFGLYFEHDWTADGPISRSDRAAWQRSIEGEISGYVNTLESDAKTSLGTYIQKSGTNSRFFVFNSLSWTRTDYANFPYADTAPAYVVDLTTGQETPSEIVTVNGQRNLQILASNVPSVGYKVFEIRNGVGASFSDAAIVTGNIIENATYKITVSTSGAITSLIDKTHGNREFIRTINGLTANDFGVSGSTLSVETAGPVSVTLKAVSASAPAHTTRITLYRDSSRIDIQNDIIQNFSGLKTWSFSFDLNSPDVQHEEVGAVIRAKLLASGGQYSPKNARYDWLTMNHFADMTDGANTSGVTISNADDYFMKLGSSTDSTLDTSTPQINVLAGGQVDGSSLGIPNQNGDSQFMQRFALQTHGAFDKTGAMKFALEHQNPFSTGQVTGTNAFKSTAQEAYSENSYSFLNISDANVLLWALKPAEDGIARGVVARVWNMSASPVNYSLSLAPALTSAKRITHIETDIADASILNGDLNASANGSQIQSHRLVSALPTNAYADVSGHISVTGRRTKITVQLINASTGETFRTKADGDGNYRFANVPTGSIILLRPIQTGFAFLPDSRTLALNSPLNDLNFTGSPRSSP